LVLVPVILSGMTHKTVLPRQTMSRQTSLATLAFL